MKRALLSVVDPTGIGDLARWLSSHGFDITATPETSTILTQSAVPVTRVNNVAQFYRDMRDSLERTFFEQRLPIRDQFVVVVNFHPLEALREVAGSCGSGDAIEYIDLDGHALIRAAAKHGRNVTIVVNPNRYPEVLEMLSQRPRPGEDVKKGDDIKRARKLRLALTIEAFQYTEAYDAAAVRHLATIQGGQWLHEAFYDERS